VIRAHCDLEEKITNHDAFGEVFDKARVAIGCRYIPGSIPYGKRMLPSVVKEISKVELKLNEIWKSNRKESLEEFRGLIKRWYLLNLSIIEEYRKHKGKRKSLKPGRV
jgi:hypothetical protein